MCEIRTQCNHAPPAGISLYPVQLRSDYFDPSDNLNYAAEDADQAVCDPLKGDANFGGSAGGQDIAAFSNFPGLRPTAAHFLSSAAISA